MVTACSDGRDRTEGLEIPRILLIDDDPLIREIVPQVLRRDHHHVETAEDGEEGLQRACKDCFDLVITDIVMPNKEGVDVIRQLRPQFPHLPILAISSGGQLGGSTYLDIARALGATATLTKPLNYPSLRSTVSQLLETSERRTPTL